MQSTIVNQKHHACARTREQDRFAEDASEQNVEVLHPRKFARKLSDAIEPLALRIGINNEIAIARGQLRVGLVKQRVAPRQIAFDPLERTKRLRPFTLGKRSVGVMKHTRDEFLRGRQLHQIVVGSAREGLGLGCRVFLGRKHHDRTLRQCALPSIALQ